MCDKEGILTEALRLTSGDRQRDYSHPREDWTRTAKMWSAILGVEVSPQKAILCMVAVKISRECHRHKRDNLVDMAGYARCLAMIEENEI